jgi:DNA-binding Lrp family transcriptional regulator
MPLLSRDSNESCRKSGIFYFLDLGGLHMDEDEKTLDELWVEGTSGTDEAAEASTGPIPADDSDVLGDESQSDTDAPASSIEDQSPPFTEAQLERLAAYMQEKVLPARDEQLLREAQNRARQSQKAQDERIKQQLAPLVDTYKRLEEQGLFTREDSQREYAAAYQKTAREIEAREQQQSQAELYQRWLASGQQNVAQSNPVPNQNPTYVTSTEARMNQILAQSGLTDQDPELNNVPLKVTHDDPIEAVDYFRVKVASAVQAKKERLHATAKPKPMIDMGMGGSGGAGNPLAGIEDTDQLWEMAMKS